MWTILFSRFASPVSLFDESSTYFRVLPTDVDVLMHMNNGRYFSLMDLARINLLIRSKHFFTFKKNKIYPVIASEMIRFRKSLDLFQRFELTSKMIGWDDKFVYVMHHFKVKGEVYALSLIKARFLHQGGGKVNPDELLALIGHQQASPPLPNWVKDWQRADQTFYDEALEINK